jgi:hypothetical protein
MTKQTKTKPKCIKGTACGYTCISAKRQCSDRILKRDADALLASVQQTPELPLPFKGEHLAREQEETFDVPPDKVTVSMGEGLLAAIGDVVEINIYVNNNTNAEHAGVTDAKQALKVAMAAMRKTREMVAKMPDGMLLSNYPTDNDGKGEARTKLYKKAGFAVLEGVGRTMYAVVVNGKITPATQEYMEKHYNITKPAIG